MIADLLDRYEDLLRAWAPRLDLFSPADRARLRTRHVDDSLRALPVLDGLSGRAIDVGSGAGLPGIPLAIAGPSELNWCLLEPRKNRAAFLEEVVRELGLDCEVVVKTAEEAARDPGLASAHAVATARALAPPVAAFRLLAPLVAPGGVAVIFVGAGGEVPPGAEGRPGGLAIMKRSPEVD